jgi:hypothetical protein
MKASGKWLFFGLYYRFFPRRETQVKLLALAASPL